jgi:pimeloyl-ACP methyl ester carboxylesterase
MRPHERNVRRAKNAGLMRRLARAGRDATGAGRAVTRAMLRPATYPGYLKEALWLGVNTAMWPVGLAREVLTLDQEVRLGDRFSNALPLRYLDPLAASTPIILLHGYFHNRSAFLVMRRSLRRAGFRTVDTMNYNVIGNDIGELAAQLARRVDHVREQTGATQVHLIGHSLGGLVARYYIQKLGGNAHVHTCVTLGTPHKGSYAAFVGRGRAARQLRPNSPLFRVLARAPKPDDVRFVCFYSNLDGMVLPPSNAKLTDPRLNVRNILVKDLGHLSLLISRPLIRSIAELLAATDGRPERTAAPMQEGGDAARGA